MPRIRSIKPEFWTSEVVASWDVETRLTFIGLWSYADDNGVGVANERLIASSIYPMDDPTEALARVREALARLSAGGQIVLFEAYGKRLLFVSGWDDHQRVDRPTRSRYPRPSELNDGPPTSPNGASREDASRAVSGSREGHAGDSRLSREQGAGSREQGAGLTPDLFAEFYAAYPRKKNRLDAEKAWRQTLKRGVTAAAVVAAASRHAELMRDTEAKYIAYPASWLRAGGYENEPDPQRTPRQAMNGRRQPNADDKIGYLQSMKTGTGPPGPPLYALPPGGDPA